MRRTHLIKPGNMFSTHCGRGIHLSTTGNIGFVTCKKCLSLYEYWRRGELIPEISFVKQDPVLKIVLEG